MWLSSQVRSLRHHLPLVSGLAPSQMMQLSSGSVWSAFARSAWRWCRRIRHLQVSRRRRMRRRGSCGQTTRLQPALVPAGLHLHPRHHGAAWDGSCRSNRCVQSPLTTRHQGMGDQHRRQRQLLQMSHSQLSQVLQQPTHLQLSFLLQLSIPLQVSILLKQHLSVQLCHRFDNHLLSPCPLQSMTRMAMRWHFLQMSIRWCILTWQCSCGAFVYLVCVSSWLLPHWGTKSCTTIRCTTWWSGRFIGCRISVRMASAGSGSSCFLATCALTWYIMNDN